MILAYNDPIDVGFFSSFTLKTTTHFKANTCSLAAIGALVRLHKCRAHCGVGEQAVGEKKQ
jgi:hypothetical protein